MAIQQLLDPITDGAVLPILHLNGYKISNPTVVFEVTDRQWDARAEHNDEFLAPDGRVVDSMLSEHQCEGWLGGYLLTG